MEQDAVERWWQIDAIFSEALDVPPDERAAFLDEACADDEDMRREVERLLEADQQAEQVRKDPVDWFVAPPLPSPDAAAERDHEVSAAHGKQVGPYRLLDEIGRGGMGTVYLAERADGQFEQKVALKLVRSGVTTDEALRRFRLERQILAVLQHLNIARLLDGGVSEEGTPYFVMEFVVGMPIDRYCDEHRLSIAERLKLFCTVCAAVQYAHQNLVVHRDLKPSNILVTQDGVPKLLDFGIAKLLDPEAQAQTLVVTQTGVRLMTPEYASPEQVRGEAVGTTSDVYQLGVLLYELLTGHRPYRLPSRLLHEVERIVCEEIPTRPSTAVTQVEQVEVSGDGGTRPITPEHVSRVRSTSVERLRRRLSGDLDTMVLMALRKEPARRYASVGALAEDVRRHLTGLPVRARPDTLVYRATKFVRRNWIGVAAALLVVLSLTVGLTVAVWLTGVAAAERDEAEQVAHVLIGLLQEPTGGMQQGPAVTVREMLDRGVARIRAELTNQPEVQARLLNVMGGVYYRQGHYAEAKSLLEEALALRQQALGPVHPDVAKSLFHVANLYHEMDRYDEAGSFFEAALVMQRKLRGDEHEDVAEILKHLGGIMHSKGDYEKAEGFYREALAMNRRLLGDEHEIVANNLRILGNLLQDRGDLDAAEPLYREALAMRRKLLGEENLEVTRDLNQFGWFLYASGAYAAAEAPLREVLAMLRKLLGDENDFVAETLSNLGLVLHAQGEYAAADSLFREALAMRCKLLGDEHRHLAPIMSNLARLLLDQGRYAEADTLFHRALAIRRKFLGDEHPKVAVNVNDLGVLHKARGEHAAADSLLRQALAMRLRLLGEAHPDVARTLHHLAGLWHEQGAYDEADSLYRAALAGLRAALPATHPHIAGPLLGLGTLLMDRDDPHAAEPLVREALALRRHALPEGHWHIAEAQSLLGRCLTGLGRYDEAEPLLLAAYAGLQATRGDQDAHTTQAREALVALYKAWDRPEAILDVDTRPRIGVRGRLRRRTK